MFYTLIHIKCIHSRVLKTHVYETAVSSMDTRCPPEPVPVTNYCLLLRNGTMPPERFKEWQLECRRHEQDLEAWRQWQTRDKELKAEALDALLKSEAEALALRQEAAAKDALPGEEAAAEEPVVNEADGPLQAGGTAARSKRIRWSCRSIKSTWAIKGTWPIKSTARRLVLCGLAVKLIQAVHALAIRRMY